MSIQVLVATMHQKKDDYSLLDRLNVQSGAVVINQCNRDEIYTIEYKGNQIVWVDSTERGLSRSRNMAIRYADAEFCLLVDDDEILVPNYYDIIEKAFADNSSASIIRFQIAGIEKQFKRYPTNQQDMGFLKSMKISSVEIAFRRKAIIENNLKFDELLGSGAEFSHGEENAFVFDCLKHGLEIIYIPKIISKLHIGDSTWFDGYNKKYFIGSGASYVAMSRKLAGILILQFAVRRYSLYKSEMSFIKAICYMFEGKAAYIQMKRQRKTERLGIDNHK